MESLSSGKLIHQVGIVFFLHESIHNFKHFPVMVMALPSLLTYRLYHLGCRSPSLLCGLA